MTRRPNSKGYPTLADVQAAVTVDTALPSQRRREIHSAINLIARAAGKRAEHMSASLRDIREALNDNTVPARLGISQRRWQNSKSLFKSAADHFGFRRSALGPVSTAWKQYQSRLPSHRESVGLSRFIRYCSAEGIEPDQVTETVMGGFLEHLESATSVEKPTQIQRRATRLWNEVANNAEGEHYNLLTLKPRRNKYQISESEWPAALLSDTNKFFDFATGNDLTADEPPNGGWQARTADTNRRYLRALVSAAHLGGQPWSSLQSLADLTSPASLSAIAQFFNTHTGRKTPYLRSLCTFLLYVARHWVRADEETVSSIKRLRKRMGCEQQDLTDKNRKLLALLTSPETVVSILGLPDVLVAEARRLNHAHRAAVLAQMAVALALLSRAPMRSGNLVQLRISDHFSGLKDPKQPITVHLQKHEVKNDRALSYPLGIAISNMLREYLQVHQPILDHNNTGWVFPGARQNHKCQRTLGQQITQITTTRLGIRITPHQFRHIAAKIILDTQPGAYPLVQQLLGHSNLATTVRAYTGTDMARATRMYDSIIEKQMGENDDDET